MEQSETAYGHPSTESNISLNQQQFFYSHAKEKPTTPKVFTESFSVYKAAGDKVYGMRQ